MAEAAQETTQTETPPPPPDSGLACLSLLAKYFEKPGDYDHRHGAPTEMADDIALVRYAKEIGFNASAIDSERDRLARTPLPCIARGRDGGWFILGKVAPDESGNGKILIQDPVVGRPKQLTREELETRWDGRLMLVATRAQLAAMGAKSPRSKPAPASLSNTCLLR